MFGLVANFIGYHPGYAKTLTAQKNRFTWAILKAHTRNNAGRVSLRSGDPQDMPDIDFRYFGSGNDSSGQDLRSVVEGVKYVRQVMAGNGNIRSELSPGPNVRTDEEIAAFVEREAWGHHASCTSKMGAKSDPMAVVNGDFKVHGVEGLRIVDASIFPKIPGFFIVLPIYMASQKASETILADAGIENFDALDFSI